MDGTSIGDTSSLRPEHSLGSHSESQENKARERSTFSSSPKPVYDPVRPPPSDGQHIYSGEGRGTPSGPAQHRRTLTFRGL
jgi:hypothetical protein